MRSQLTEVYRGVKTLLLDLAALVWPTECAVCGTADRDLCDECRAELVEPMPVLRSNIGVPCLAAGPYDEALRELLIEFKHHGRVGFARVLAEKLRAPLMLAIAECESVPLLVAAPSRPARIRRRGFRPVELLVAEAVRGRAIPHIRLRALRAGRGRTAQVGLTAAERERNAARVRVSRLAMPALQGREVIVVDDVLTTGATLRAACAALEGAGATVVTAVALCAARRRDDRSQSGVAATSVDAVEFGETIEHAT